jgi:hypothetical protein
MLHSSSTIMCRIFLTGREEYTISHRLVAHTRVMPQASSCLANGLGQPRLRPCHPLARLVAVRHSSSSTIRIGSAAAGHEPEHAGPGGTHHDMSRPGHSGQDHGHEHDHGGPDPGWGLIRTGLWTALHKSGLLEVSHASSHSLLASISSALLLAASAALVWCSPGSHLQAPLASPASAFASVLYVASLALSALSAIVDALLQACLLTFTRSLYIVREC